MEPSCVRQSLIPGTSRLFADYLYDFDRVASFYPHNFSDPAGFSQAAAAIHYPDERRQKLVAALREQNGDSPALERLAQPGTLAVVTGQQVGLFSGPSYTVFKAMTAVRLAAQLTESGIRAVPVFWLASEDHDLAEVDHVWFFDAEARAAKIDLANAVVNGGPVGSVPVTDIPWADVRAALGTLPFADETVERLRRAYAPDATFTSGFRALLRDLLSQYGLLFLDPLAPAIREIARPFLSQTVERVPELLSALKARDRELSQAGYHSQVHLDAGTSLLFLLGDGKRTAIRWQDGRFAVRDKSFETAELIAMSERLSPNALLRPVMQDYLLPTVSYVGGPAEIAYMAQGEVLYRNLLGRMPVIFPRNSFTLLDSRAEKLLKKYNLHVTDLLDHRSKVKTLLASRLVPSNLAREFEDAAKLVTATVEKLKNSLHVFDPTLEAASHKSTAKMLYQLHRLSEKTARETLRRDERSARDTDYLIDLVYPDRHLQERYFSIVPFLAKHGPDLPERLLDFAQLSCPDHMVRTV